MAVQQTLSEKLQVRLSPTDYKRFQRLAEERQRDMGELARIVLRNWMDDKENHNNKEKKNG